MSDRRDVWITGIGLVSSLGEGLEAHWTALSTPAKPAVDETTYAPYVLHPLAKIDFDQQIPKRGDQRQMEPWQRIGTYAAGLALDSAGLKGNKEVLATTDMVVAAGGGERDQTVDGAILTDIEKQPNPEVFLSEQLQSNLRPTLFLAQLSNLLAGNISIVHGVTGSSRTFMGEESSGTDAVRIGWSRIAAGTSEIALVGGAYNAERRDMLLLFALKSVALHSPWAPVLADPKGVPTGSAGAFLVLESPEHAMARGAKPIAKLSGVWSERAKRGEPGAIEALVDEMIRTAKGDVSEGTAILSAACGAPEPTSAEVAAISRSGLPVRSVTDRVGHSLEAQMPVALALAALAVSKGKLFAPLEGETLEEAFEGTLTRAIVTGVGHWRGEGVALVERVD
ncbi:3-oxoacyl-[acyl-carrier-protein] synthase II [Angulomicrobium tetraedrale]|uniref:3-oxoacyl-[acyl-carrier-protein] synthase II n=1 Tax=Ancylobacter tetraedralis TaxID=217068 RepID=A0A839Z6W5_9HYPH|nr:beta-ketoacyl-ACP synthase [Ancylobacter tetraedralis]MBB3770116.1 3-oxoacyl-[acyl-carrier-protein] synthase II [Ancylobacter tetraedralis]